MPDAIQESAGAAEGSRAGSRQFEITFGNNTTMQQVFELIQAMGAEAGFDITLRPVEFASLQSSLARGDFVVGQSGWSGASIPAATSTSI